MHVVTGGIEVRNVFDGEPTPTCVPPTEDPAGLPDLLQLLDRLVPVDGMAVAVVPTWGPARQRETYDAARALLPSRSLLVVETSLPPLAASLAVSTLAALVARVGGPDVAALVWPHLEREMVSLAWLSSVTGLGHLDVPLGLHARSYVSRHGFVAQIHPRAGLARVGRDPAALQLTLPPRPRALVADQEGDGNWREMVLRPALTGALSTTSAPPGASHDWWGSRRFVEVAVGPGDLDDLAGRLRTAAAPVTCRWCGTTTSTDQSCVRCGQWATGPLAGARKVTE